MSTIAFVRSAAYALVLVAPLLALGHCGGGAPEGPYLAAWTGDADREESDFLAVINVDRASPDYGRVVASVTVGERSTHPHHTEHSFTRGRSLFASGFGGNRILRFDLSDPLHPRLAGTVEPPPDLHYSHSFERLPSGHVLATMQGRNAEDEAPGGIVEFREDGSVARWASARASGVDNETMRPYSLAVLPEWDRAVTASGIMGLPAWHPRSEAILKPALSGRWSVHLQLWRLSDLSLLATSALTAPEGEDVNRVPYEPRVLEDGQTVMVTTAFCGLYRVRSLETETFGADLVYRFDGESCFVPVRIGRFWVQAVTGAKHVAVLDVSDPSRPFEVSRVQFDEGQTPHWLAFDESESRIVVVNDETGERRIWMLHFDRSTGSISLDEGFRDPGSEQPGVSFDRSEWPHGTTGPAIPHGTVFIQ